MGLLSFGNKAYITNPTQYATQQKHSRAPPTQAEAARQLKGYDYGERYLRRTLSFLPVSIL